MAQRQRLTTSVRRMAIAHVVFWTLYSVIVAFIVPQFYHADGFEQWSLILRIGVALLPVIPVALWLGASARYLSRTPDEYTIRMVTDATCSAAIVLVLVLFAQGWLELIVGPEIWPRFVFFGFDTTPWAYVALFGLIWAIELVRRTQAKTS